MKKIYTLFLVVTFLGASAQNYGDLLKNTDWKIVKIQWFGTEYFPPFPLQQSGKVDFKSSNNGFYSAFFNSAGGSVTFGGNNAAYFTLQNIGVTLAEYSGPNEYEVRQFDYMTTGFYFGYEPTQHFNFEFKEVFSGRNLTVTNPQGSKIFYSNFILGAQDQFLNKSINLYPNPAKDEFYIKTSKSFPGQLKVEIFDTTGKLVSSQKMAATEAVNTQALANGLYVVKVTGLGVEYSSKLMIKK